MTKDRKNMKSIKNWYQSKFPEYSLGSEINEKATFSGLKNNLPNVYDYLNVSDSIIRERVFAELSFRMELDYEHIYNKWMMQIA